jgi:UDP-N-acetylglucosamine 4-epimerase
VVILEESGGSKCKLDLTLRYPRQPAENRELKMMHPRIWLKNDGKVWLVTGVAGFIGSNLLETLLQSGQRVTGLDNFATGRRDNLAQVKESVTRQQWARFAMLEGDICEEKACRRAAREAQIVLHQAALGSVPRSLEEPLLSHASNVTGFLNMLVAARDAGAQRFVYASSSAVYGDEEGLPKVESKIGRPLSPYAATKAMNEIYADVFARCYQLETIGLRYFNVFGPRQDPDGAYAAVIPKWIAAMIRNQPVQINGDGETSRDFCYIANVVQANLKAATTTRPGAINQVYNVAVSQRTTLNQLFEMLRQRLLPRCPHLKDFKPVYQEFRPGDVRHSHADITTARRLLGYRPGYDIERGLDEALDWYVANLTSPADRRKAKNQARLNLKRGPLPKKSIARRPTEAAQLRPPAPERRRSQS